MITDIRLQNFRSYTDDLFEFDTSVNIVVGPNASGKTNLLEAILVLARGSSYRVRDQELISFNQDWMRLDAHLQDGAERVIKLSSTDGKTYEISGKAYKRLNYSQTIPLVLFEPNHLNLLNGSPDNRRSYLDDLLEQVIPAYKLLRQQYRRALAQRNTLLKKGNPSSAQLFPWDVRLSQLAGQIVRYRANIVESMNQRMPSLYQNLSQTQTRVSLKYDSQWPDQSYESNMLKKLEANSELDAQRGFTSAGPHREDLVVLFDGHPAGDVASRGEIRTLVLGLKVLEMDIIKSARDTTPLLLLDDVFSELDGARRKALTNYLQPYQTFITTTDADVVIQNFTETCHIIPLSSRSS